MIRKEYAYTCDTLYRPASADSKTEGGKLRLVEVKDVNYRTEENPDSVDKVDNNHTIMTRLKLKSCQDTYAEAMTKYGLQRGIDGSEAKHISKRQYYRDLAQQTEQLRTDIELSKTARNSIGRTQTSQERSANREAERCSYERIHQHSQKCRFSFRE